MAALALYTIDITSHDGVPMYLLDGGMSAEYGVAQALANLDGGVAHTWDVQAPGMGPNPVLGGKDFLAKSLTRTVAYYDDLLGAGATVDTVVLGTGVSSASYVCHALDAPFLPVHFLLSTDSVAGTQDVLDTALASGLPAYATLGYDESMPDVAVAWIKLLTLPPQYADFLRRHQVRQVVVLGATGASGQFGRRPGAHRPRIAPGDTLVTWPDCGSSLDDTWLRRTIADLDAQPLEEPALPIADWESGLAEEALEGFAAGLAAIGVDGHLLTAPDYLAMYDVGSVAHAAGEERDSRHRHRREPLPAHPSRRRDEGRPTALRLLATRRLHRHRGPVAPRRKGLPRPRRGGRAHPAGGAERDPQRRRP